jgi:antitoxin component YwqK of YwqJK toxin-antitoxin module
MEENLSEKSTRVHENNLKIAKDWAKLIDTAYLKGELFSGISFDVHSNGQIWSEIPHILGLRNGIQKSWYDSGQLKSEVMWINGLQDGMSKGWHPNGQLSYDWPLDKNIPSGVWKSYYDDGRLEEVKRFINGLRVSSEKY